MIRYGIGYLNEYNFERPDSDYPDYKRYFGYEQDTEEDDTDWYEDGEDD